MITELLTDISAKLVTAQLRTNSSTADNKKIHDKFIPYASAYETPQKNKNSLKFTIYILTCLMYCSQNSLTI